MISPEQILLRLVVAAILGALVGLERERLEWAAGMRTHALVCLGSALFMVVSIFGFSDILNERHVVLDPSRVAAQVASGCYELDQEWLRNAESGGPQGSGPTGESAFQYGFQPSS